MLWAFIPVVSKSGQQTLDQYQFLFWSSITSFFTLLMVTLLSGKGKQLFHYKTKDVICVAFLGLLGTFLYYLLLYQGYRISDGMSVLVMQYTWPLFIAVLSIFILSESFTKAKLLGLILGMSGVLLVLTKGNITNLSLRLDSALLWVMAGAFCFALFSVLSKKVSYEPLSLNTWYFAVASIASGILMLSVSTSTFPSGDALQSVLANGIFINGISYLFWIQALRKLPATDVAIFTFSTPAFSAIYLYVFFADEFLPIYYVSLLLVILAGFVARFPSRNNTRAC